MEIFIRNFAHVSDLVIGTPIRTTEFDASADATFVEQRPNMLVMQRPDGSLFPVRWQRDLYPNRFPLHSTSPLTHESPVPITELAIGDCVSFISDHAHISNIYRRPNADWARVTLTETVNRRRHTVNVSAVSDSPLTRNDLLSLKGVDHDIEKAGPYYDKDEQRLVWFTVHPTGRGRYPDVTGALKPPPMSHSDWARYEYRGKHSTGRHPNHFARTVSPAWSPSSAQAKTAADWT